MNNLIHADLFFFVTTIVVIVVGLLIAVLIVYVLIILNNLKKLSERLKKEGIEIVDEFSEWRERVSEVGRNGFGIGSAIAFFSNLFKGKVRPKPLHKKNKVVIEDEDNSGNE